MRSFLPLLLVVGFAIVIAPSDAIAQKEVEISVKAGKTKCERSSRVSIRLVEVVEDSRCPEGVNCIWAGRAVVKITAAKRNEAPATFELADNDEKASVEFAGYRIYFKSLLPKPTADGSPKLEEYVAVFRLEKL
jgi:hypothetical protein